jgi:hypothetical protein
MLGDLALVEQDRAAGSTPAAMKAAATSRVLWRSFSGSCQTVIACRSTTQ